MIVLFKMMQAIEMPSEVSFTASSQKTEGHISTCMFIHSCLRVLIVRLQGSLIFVIPMIEDRKTCIC